jgi:hypothetical protein
MKVRMSFYTRAVVYKEVEMTQEAYDGMQAQLENLRGREAAKFGEKMFAEFVGSFTEAEFDDDVELNEFEPVPPESESENHE